MSKRTLVTGIRGQDGSYLTELQLAKCYVPHGIVRESPTFGADPANAGAGRQVSVREHVEMTCDLTDSDGENRWDATRSAALPPRILDRTRARERFGRKAEVGLENTMRRTIDGWESVDECLPV